MIGVLFATRREADPFIRMTGAAADGSGPFDVLIADGPSGLPLTIALSGMGKVAGAAAAGHLILARKVSVLINAGICGRLTRAAAAAVGDCFRINSAVEGDSERFGKQESAIPCDGRFFRHLPQAGLVTCDRPVFEADRRMALARLGDLIDMEGAAIARVAGLYDIPCAMLKGVSDGAGETGRQDLARNIDRVSVRVAGTLIDGLTRISGIESHDI